MTRHTMMCVSDRALRFKHAGSRGTAGLLACMPYSGCSPPGSCFVWTGRVWACVSGGVESYSNRVWRRMGDPGVTCALTHCASSTGICACVHECASAEAHVQRTLVACPAACVPQGLGNTAQHNTIQVGAARQKQGSGGRRPSARGSPEDGKSLRDQAAHVAKGQTGTCGENSNRHMWHMPKTDVDTGAPLLHDLTEQPYTLGVPGLNAVLDSCVGCVRHLLSRTAVRTAVQTPQNTPTNGGTPYSSSNRCSEQGESH